MRFSIAHNVLVLPGETMNVVRPKELIVAIFATANMLACAPGGPSGPGAGGQGGDDSGNATASSSSSTSSSSSSGSPVCDTKSVTCTECTDCSRKSADGLCVTKYNNCLGNMPCVEYAKCVGTCMDGDKVCLSNCESFWPTGIPIYDAYVSCVICQDCYVKCDGANLCN